MFWIDLILVFFFALILSALLGWGLGWRHPARTDAFGASFLFLFLVLLLVMWAGGAWLHPWGPVLYGSSWLAFLLIGLLAVLFILAVASPPARRRIPRKEAEEAVAESAAFGLFFWLLILGLLVALIAAYWT